MRALLLALLLLASPASAVTRMYFTGYELPDVYPAVASGWGSSPDSKYRHLGTAVGDTSGTNSGILYNRIVNLSGTTTDFIYVSAPLASGTFTSGVTTVKAVVQMAEVATTDDVDRCILSMRIVNNAGTSTVTTLLAPSNYGPTAELIQGASTDLTTMRTKQCADGDTVTASHSVSAGERLVVEFGFQNSSGAGTTPQARSASTVGAAGSDCAENETTTSACRAWVETSADLTFSAQTRVAQTFYFNRSRAMSITPAAGSGWTTTTGFIRRRLDAQVNGSRNFPTTPVSITAANTAALGLHSQYISLPMAAGIVFDDASTRMTIVASISENNGADDVARCAAGVRILSEDGSTERVVLRAPVFSMEARVEVGTTAYHQRTCLDNALVSNDYTTVAGDRLVVELGCGTLATGTTPECLISPGDNDMIDEAAGTATTLCRLGADQSNHNDCVSFADFYGITFAKDTEPDPGPTRVYFPASSATALTPGVHANWDESDELVRHELALSKGSSANGAGQTVDTTEDSQNEEVDRQYISVPLRAGIQFEADWTTVKGQIMMRQFNSSDGVRPATTAIKIVDGAGADQVVLLAGAAWFVDAASSAAPDQALSSTFMQSWTSIAEGTPVQLDYTTVAGDRLVIELGARVNEANTTPQWAISYGESASDCTYRDNTSTTTCTSWVEFSNLIQAEGVARNPIVIH